MANILYSKCCVCGGNMLQRTSKQVHDAINIIKLKSETVGPGGRKLDFYDGKSITLSDMCGYCDEKKLWDFIQREYPDIFTEMSV